MRIEIPEYKTLNIDTIFADFNGTLAIDGVIPPSVRQRILTLAGNFQIYVLTADTNGTAKEQCEGLPVCLQTFPTGNVRESKKELLKSIGSRHCAAIGNGRNDELMLREAALSIAVMDQEGAYGKVMREADLCTGCIEDALDLLIYPKRIIAGLRG